MKRRECGEGEKEGKKKKAKEREKRNKEKGDLLLIISKSGVGE